MVASDNWLNIRPEASTGTSWFGEASRRQVVGWLFFTLLLCLHFALTYTSNREVIKLATYMRGQGSTPYQYRILPMYIFRFFMGRPVLLTIARHAPAALRDPYKIILLGIAFLSTLGAVLATAGTLTRLTADRLFSLWFSLIIVYMAYFNLAPGWGLSYTLPYDTPSLFFFCLATYFLVAGRKWLFYLIFPISVFNRETTCFLTLFFLIWLWSEQFQKNSKMGRRAYAILLSHMGAQLTIWIVIKTYLNHRFAANPIDGAPMFSYALLRMKLPFNFKELLEPQQWPVLLSCFGFLLPALWMGRRWIRHPGIIWTCSIILPAWFLGMMMVGVITEIRVFSELSAFIVPALAIIVHNRFRPVIANVQRSTL